MAVHYDKMNQKLDKTNTKHLNHKDSLDISLSKRLKCKHELQYTVWRGNKEEPKQLT